MGICGEGRPWGDRGIRFPLPDFYGLVVKTLGFQPKDGSSSLLRSVGRIILFICIKRYFIGNNGYFSI